MAKKRLGTGTVTTEKVRLDRGGYDETGKYYGVGEPLFRVWYEDETVELPTYSDYWESRARDRADLLRKASAHFFELTNRFRERRLSREEWDAAEKRKARGKSGMRYALGAAGRASSRAYNIARYWQLKKPAPWEARRDWSDITIEQVHEIDAAATEAYGPGGKGEDWHAKQIDKVLAAQRHREGGNPSTTKSDKAVIRAFLNKKAEVSKKLTSDGKRLDGNWMGGRGIAEWMGGKISFTYTGGKEAQRVQRAVIREAPILDIDEGSTWAGGGAFQKRWAAAKTRELERAGSRHREGGNPSTRRRAIPRDKWRVLSYGPKGWEQVYAPSTRAAAVADAKAWHEETGFRVRAVYGAEHPSVVTGQRKVGDIIADFPKGEYERTMAAAKAQEDPRLKAHREAQEVYFRTREDIEKADAFSYEGMSERVRIYEKGIRDLEPFAGQGAAGAKEWLGDLKHRLERAKARAAAFYRDERGLSHKKGDNPRTRGTPWESAQSKALRELRKAYVRTAARPAFPGGDFDSAMHIANAIANARKAGVPESTIESIKREAPFMMGNIRGETIGDNPLVSYGDGDYVVQAMYSDGRIVWEASTDSEAEAIREAKEELRSPISEADSVRVITRDGEFVFEESATRHRFGDNPKTRKKPARKKAKKRGKKKTARKKVSRKKALPKSESAADRALKQRMRKLIPGGR